MGPELDLMMTYSPTTSDDRFGLGIGMTLAFCMYSKASHTLYLWSGEAFKVIESDASNDVYLQQQKIASATFKKLSEHVYHVVDRDGTVTVLSDGGDDIFRPTRIFSPLGFSLTLNWEPMPNSPRLASVVDDGNNVLFRCQPMKPSNDLEMTFLPGTDESYVLKFRRQVDYLYRIESSALPQGAWWTYSYQPVGVPGLNTLYKTVTPTGLVKEVVYNRGSTTGIMHFPDSAKDMAPLPAVTTLTVRPNHGQPAIVTHYTPNEGYFNNYLGYGGRMGGAWDPDSDNCYEVLDGDYRYITEVSQTDSGNKTTRSTYTYNNYHLLVAVESVQADCVHRTDVEFYATPGKNFDDQPANFQFPKQQIETWERTRQGSRSEVSDFEYDAMGNLVRQVSPDGTTIVSTYYSANGEPNSADGLTGCPEDPTGFGRFIKARKIIPSSSSFGDEPVRQTLYRYATLVALPGAPMSVAVVPVQEVEAECGAPALRLLRQVEFTYGEPSCSNEPVPIDFGRVCKRTTTHYDVDGQPHSRVLDSTYSTRKNRLVRHDTLTSHDGLAVGDERVASRWTARVLEIRDPIGNGHTFEYDALGRLVKRTRNADTPYEAQFISEHTISLKGDIVDSITSTHHDDAGNAVRITFDAMGRPLQIERNAIDADATDVWRAVRTLTYDALGRVFESSESDYTDALKPTSTMTVSTTVDYDAWGESESWLDSTGVITVERYDPIAHTTTSQTQVTGGKIRLGSHVTHFNDQNLPTSVKALDRNGGVDGAVAHEYDALGRLRTTTDEVGNTTSYSYDAYDRIEVQCLADGTHTRLSYAPFAAASLPIRIEVTPPLSQAAIIAGEQTFDGFGRLTSATCGGRKTTLHYAAVVANRNPCSVTDNIGQTLQYEYIPELANAISGCAGSTLSQRFTYDAPTGNMLTIAEDGSQTQQIEWWPSGARKGEQYDRQTTDSRTTSYAWTLQGKLLEHIDVGNQVQTITYDAFGRPKRIDDPSVTVSLDYDEASRIVKHTATSHDKRSLLTTDLSWDDFDRETRRDIIASDGTTLSIAQAYRKNDQVASRTSSSNGQVIRLETFTYDDRNRLTEYACDGTSPTYDAYGHAIRSQAFTLDALSNISSCTTTLTDGNVDIMVAEFANPLDATQLTAVTHTLTSHYPARVDLAYDANGRMIRDEEGRTLTYDEAGRLIGAKGSSGESTYQYDGLNRLIAQIIDSADTRELFYRGNKLVNELQIERNINSRSIQSPLGTAAVDDANMTSRDIVRRASSSPRSATDG